MSNLHLKHEQLQQEQLTADGKADLQSEMSVNTSMHFKRRFSPNIATNQAKCFPKDFFAQ